jgi:hypothetical protein
LPKHHSIHSDIEDKSFKAFLVLPIPDIGIVFDPEQNAVPLACPHSPNFPVIREPALIP